MYYELRSTDHSRMNTVLLCVLLLLLLLLSRYCVRVVHSGTKNSFTMPLMLSFWGKEENQQTVKDNMACRGFKLNTGGGKATGTKTNAPQTASGLTRILVGVLTLMHTHINEKMSSFHVCVCVCLCVCD